MVPLSGETHNIIFVDESTLPKNRKDRLEVIRHMYSHANFCMSGDNTLAAAIAAIEDVRKEEGDDYYVFLLSDANLSAYGVTPKTLAKAMLVDSKVNSYAIFIAAELAAEQMKKGMPVGHAHACLDTKDLPRIFKEIFAHSLLSEARL
jgi:hypothetical protein